MDAKPHRPLRAFKVRDENLVPQLPAGKTIHHRNKSTPALSTLMQAGAQKPVAKRSAFADVSNTVKNTCAKDDIALAGKKGVELVKTTVLPSISELSRPAAITRPAQRPLSTATHVNKSNGALNTGGVALLPQEPLAQPVQPLQARKTVTKRSTTVFRESAEEPVQSMIQVQKPTSVHPYTHPVHQALHAPKVTQTEVSLSKDAQKAMAPPVQVEPRPMATVEPAQIPLPVDKYESYDQHLEHPAPSRSQVYEPLPRAVENKTLYLPALEHQALASEVRHHVDLERYQPEPVAQAIEEWDYEEEEDEYFETEGYTTARSIRSRGDNTTGGVTIVLAPVVTQKVERELAAAKAFVESNLTEEDIEDESYDTSMVAEYGEEIFGYMRALEDRMRPNPYYMDNQAEIQWSMRSVLMDWLVQVHTRFSLLPETLFLAVNYVDRFLSCKVVSLGKLQLVGATAIFVAAKYEEINCPSVQEIVYMVDGGYTVEEILKAERFMLSMLQFELGWPGPMSFLRRISKADDYDLETRTLAKYFLEITVMDERFVGCPPSFTAAGAHCLARHMLKKEQGDWTQAHVHYSGYTLSQLRHLVNTILECCEEPLKHHQAVFDKYAEKRFTRCSLYVEAQINKGYRFPAPVRSSHGNIADGLTQKFRLRQ